MGKKLGRNDICWCGSNKKYKKCHEAFDSKIHSFEMKGAVVPPREIIKTEEQIQGIKASGKINTAVLDYVAKHIKAGVTTEQVNQWVHDETIRNNATPAPLNYQGFPKSTCVSINEEVCHGIPSDDIILKDGDIVNVDVSTIFNGYFSDSSRMFCIGEVSDEKRRLVEKTRESIYVGLEHVKPWGFLGDMGQAISDFARENGYSVVEEFGGHGIGLAFHEEPFVSHVSTKGEEMLMVPGMVFTIEPMINMGSSEIYIDEDNNWVALTADGKPSAQWEVQVLITTDGYEIISS